MDGSASYQQRKLWFEGNSLLNLKAGSGATTVDYGGKYIPISCYNNLLSNVLALNSLAVESRTGTQILASAPTAIVPYLRQGDIVVYWEGINDMYLNSLTGAQAWANVTSYLALVKTTTAKVIICTAIARDFTLDPASLMDTNIPAYNTLIRNNTSLGYTVCDLAANALFDTRADASNATYYQADKVHLQTAGSDVIHPLITTAITAIL